MGIRNLFKRSKNIDDPRYWPNIFAKLFGFETVAGVTISPDNAMQLSAVYACVRVIAETIASLPLMIYQHTKDGGKEAKPKHPLYPILHNAPNSLQTSFEHREMYMGQTLLRGNAYDYISRDRADRILELIPLDPSKITIWIEKGKKKFEYKPQNEKEKWFAQNEVWHKKGLSLDGYVGISPIEKAKEVFGLSKAQEEYGARFFRNNARPSGILKTPAILKTEQQEKLKESWQDAFTDENQQKVALMMGDLSWEQVSLSNEDSQFLESRTFQIEEIARIFRVPSILIGHPDKTMTYASAEQFMLSFVVHTIRPWLVRLEQSMNQSLLSESDRKKGIFIEHKVEGLLRGDIKSRYEAYAIARQNTWMNANEIRRLENMNPREGGDIYENPNIATGGDDAIS